MRFMLDTNICIYIIKKKPPKILKRFRTFELSDITISSITLAELEYGIAKSNRPQQNREALSGFLAPLEILPFDDHAASHYGEIRAYLESKGKSIGPIDMLIASHAISLSITLITNNTREFKRIPGLQLENWL